jgi:hypothetical protein
MLVSRLFFALIVVSLTASCVAQDHISISSAVGSEQIKEWLAGDDLRLVAWGAYFASRVQDANNDPEYLTLMARRMARWVDPPERTWEDRRNSMRQRDAMKAILSALIEKNEQVPVVSLTPIAGQYEFPTEALILGARLPADDFHMFLREWCDKNGPRENPDEIWNRTEACTPVVAMLLAKAPPPGFAAIVLNDNPREELSFRVVDANSDSSSTKRDRGSDAGIECKGSREDSRVQNAEIQERELSRWPPLFTYLLQNSASPYPGTLLVDAAGEGVTYRRITILTNPTGCYPPPSVFYQDFKRHLLAEMLKTSADSTPWTMNREVTYFLRQPADFLPAVKQQIHLEEAGFRATIQALEDRGYLAPEEAAKIKPELLVIVIDGRSGADANQRHLPPLPEFKSKNPLITVAYDMR